MFFFYLFNEVPLCFWNDKHPFCKTQKHTGSSWATNTYSATIQNYDSVEWGGLIMRSLKLWPSQNSAVTSFPQAKSGETGRRSQVTIVSRFCRHHFFSRGAPGCMNILHSVEPTHSTCLPALCRAHPHHQPAHSFYPLPACLGCHFSASFHIMVMWGPCLPTGMAVAKWRSHTCPILWPYCLMSQLLS